MKRKAPALPPLNPVHKQQGVACPNCGAIVAGMAATVGCATCPGRFCAACVGAHQRPNDAAGHACCAATSTDCPACGRTDCNLFCGAVHPAVVDALGHACCAATSTDCPACGRTDCNLLCGAVHPSAVDALGHACCPATGVYCRGCNGHFCNALCAGAHPRSLDPALHPLCPAVPHTQCPACAKLFCNAQCIGGHASVLDVGGHPVCADVLNAACPVCNGRVCDAVCKAAHVVADLTCGHQACPATAATVATCAGCAETYCGICKGAAVTVDLCAACGVEKSYQTGSINVRHALIPGKAAALSRTHTAEGPIRAVAVGDRATPPPPLSTGKTDSAADIGDMKQWDRGHLIALELDGVDDSYAIAPMMRQFNRAGTWRKMEETIVALIGGTDAEDVNGATVAATGSAPTVIDVSLRTMNTVDANWHMEVYLFYHEDGDPRVPVWFYVRVLYKKKLWTHFSHANRCNEPAALPSRTESIEFQAATDIYAALSSAHRGQIASDLTRGMYRDAGVVGAPPNQILEFMDEVNAFCTLHSLARVFTVMQDVTKKASTAYDDFQRPILRKYKRWQHAGPLRSDVPTDWLYELERKDIYQVLSECGNRSAPEVDHVNPSYQGGGNFYINARLVSFYHNHLYREKKVIGSMRVNEELFALYRTDAKPRPLAFMSTASSLSDVTGRSEFKLRFWTATGEKVHPASFVVAAISIKSDGVVNGTTAAAQFLDTHFADDVLFGVGRTLNPGVGSAIWPYQDGTVWAMVQARQTFLQAHDDREKKYAVEAGLLPAYKDSIDAHEAGLAAFIADQNHPERKRLLKLIGDAKKTGGQPLPLCKPSDVLLAGGGLSGGAAAGAYVDVRGAPARGDSHYTDLVDTRWEAVKTKLT